MDANRKRISAIVLTSQIQQLADMSSSDSNEEEFSIVENMFKKRMKVHRITNYVETILPMLTNLEFKAHFRYYLCK